MIRMIVELKRLIMFHVLAPKSQRYFWTKEWQVGEGEADIDISTGGVVLFSSASSLINDLHNLRDK